MNYQQPIIIEPPETARSAIIWLHGLGADGTDFVPIVSQLRVQESLGIRFVFPHAPIRAVTVNQGQPMPAWYDIYSAALEQKMDYTGIAQSVSYLNKLVADQRDSGIPSSRLILAGFSQGGVIALDCALRMQEKPAGVIALSTYLAAATGTGVGLSVFHAHGAYDDVVPPMLGEMAARQLNQLGAQVESHQYAVAHSVHPDEIADIAVWLHRLMPSVSTDR